MTVNYQYDLIQGTDEWLEARLGLITASQMKLILSPKPEIETRIKKNGELYKQREWDPVADNDKVRALFYQLAYERITKRTGDNFQSFAMLRGEKEEILAKDMYSEHYNQVKDCGFITNDDLGFKIGMSPDGLVGEDGGIEVKSRDGKHQVETIIEGDTPAEFMAQVQGFFLVTGRKSCDFISYSNGMHMFVKTEEPDPEWQDALKQAVIAAEKQIEKIVADYHEKTENLVKADWIDVMGEGDITPSDNADQSAYMAG